MQAKIQKIEFVFKLKDKQFVNKVNRHLKNSVQLQLNRTYDHSIYKNNWKQVHHQFSYKKQCDAMYIDKFSQW